MSVSLYLLIGFFLAAGAGAILYMMIKSKRFFRSLLFSILSGTGILLIIHFTSLMTGFALPINWISLSATAIGGLPAVLALTAIKFLL